MFNKYSTIYKLTSVHTKKLYISNTTKDLNRNNSFMIIGGRKFLVEGIYTCSSNKELVNKLSYFKKLYKCSYINMFKDVKTFNPDFKLSNETRKLMSKAKKGRKPNNYGKKVSPERLIKMKSYIASEQTKDKLRNANVWKKKVLCITNNTVYESIYDAARKLNISDKTVRHSLNGGKSRLGYTFKLS